MEFTLVMDVGAFSKEAFDEIWYINAKNMETVQLTLQGGINVSPVVLKSVLVSE